MRRRTRVRFLVIASTAVAVLVVGWLWWTRADGRPPLASLSAPLPGAPAKIAVGSFDRPWIATDHSTGPSRGRLYCTVKEYRPFLFVSRDLGRTFLPPMSWSVDLTHHMPIRPGNPVVLSDGTVVLHHDQRPKDPERRPLISVLVSRDAGATFEVATPVDTSWRDERVRTSNCNLFPQMAADTQSTRHQDRLYCVWEDGSHLNEQRILLSSSADKGRSWSAPLVLSEQPAGPTDEGDYATFMPSIAVNRHGIVAVPWYDRRGLPKTDALGETHTGCNVRLRASLDGGSTWSASVQVNERTIGIRCGILGGDLWHTAGIAADAEGSFHPAWIDDRTGTRQVWTATVSVEMP